MVSANFFVGKHIGEGNAKTAKRFSNLIKVVSYIWAVLSMIIVYSCSEPIMKFYNPNTNTISAMRQAWQVFLVFIFFDCTQAVSSANINGLSLVAKVKYVTMINYWIFGIPLSIVAMFYFDLGLAGLWMGPTLACALNWAVYEHYINSADWEKISQDTVKKMNEEKDKMEAK